MPLSKFKQYFESLSSDNKTVEVKVGNKFLDICDISVDIYGNAIIYTREQEV